MCTYVHVILFIELFMQKILHML